MRRLRQLFRRGRRSGGSVDTAGARTSMDAALRRAIDEHLRPDGFTGSLPHLRRRRPGGIDLLTVQHFSSGGSFVVEVATSPPDGFVTSWNERIPPSKVTAHDIPTPRGRLGSDSFPDGDHWFDFAPRSYEGQAEFESRTNKRLPIGPDQVAAEVISLVRSQAEPFWAAGTSHSRED